MSCRDQEITRLEARRESDVPSALLPILPDLPSSTASPSLHHRTHLRTRRSLPRILVDRSILPTRTASASTARAGTRIGRTRSGSSALLVADEERQSQGGMEQGIERQKDGGRTHLRVVLMLLVVLEQGLSTGEELLLLPLLQLLQTTKTQQKSFVS